MTQAESCIFQTYDNTPGYTPPDMESPDGACFGAMAHGTNIHDCCYQATLTLFQATDRTEWPMLMDEILGSLGTDKTDNTRRRAILAALEKLHV